MFKKLGVVAVVMLVFVVPVKAELVTLICECDFPWWNFWACGDCEDPAGTFGCPTEDGYAELSVEQGVCTEEDARAFCFVPGGPWVHLHRDCGVRLAGGGGWLTTDQPFEEGRGPNSSDVGGGWAVISQGEDGEVVVGASSGMMATSLLRRRAEHGSPTSTSNSSNQGVEVLFGCREPSPEQKIMRGEVTLHPPKKPLDIEPGAFALLRFTYSEQGLSTRVEHASSERAGAKYAGHFEENLELTFRGSQPARVEALVFGYTFPDGSLSYAVNHRGHFVD